MPKRKVQQIHEGEWLEWNNHERWICCDCHLTHHVQFRRRRGKLQVMMTVNRRSTAAYRREHGIKIAQMKSKE